MNKTENNALYNRLIKSADKEIKRNIQKQDRTTSFQGHLHEKSVRSWWSHDIFHLDAKSV